MSRSNEKCTCAHRRVNAADVCAFVVTWRGTTRQRTSLVHVCLREVGFLRGRCIF